ncbi:hypothetical protein C5E45_32990 [Nocardia nova]|uniref:DUF3168 domain-containing protein n=1 Tax=Nocardia nova TaxID=37330 RepID=A0A2S6ACZ2_9NOCA|nr:hypothetical protein [Nocardia nova]PPJ31909.1 hypothetical protein C5E45_32990 [Nocardia nova]
MTEIYVPDDPLVPFEEFLAARLAAKFANVRVAQNLSEGWQPGSPPEVVLADDSGPMRYPVETLPQVRVTVWADGRTNARAIAGHALGLLLCVKVPGIAKVLPGTLLIDDRDDRTGGWFASFTVRTRVRTVPTTA